MVLVAAGHLLSMHRTTWGMEALSSPMTSNGSLPSGCMSVPCWSQPLDSPCGCSLASAVSECKLHAHTEWMCPTLPSSMHSSALGP